MAERPTINSAEESRTEGGSAPQYDVREIGQRRFRRTRQPDDSSAAVANRYVHDRRRIGDLREKRIHASSIIGEFR